MGIGRFRLFEQRLPYSRPSFQDCEETFEEFCAKQHARVARTLTQRENEWRERRASQDGGYVLTIKGHKPAQVALTETPEELLKGQGAVGYGTARNAYLTGS
jgi:hypothetical protein